MSEFLKFLYNEDIYKIDEPDLNEPGDTAEVIEVKTASKEPEEIELEVTSISEILVIIRKSETKEENEAHISYLFKILNSVNISESEVELLQLTTDSDGHLEFSGRKYVMAFTGDDKVVSAEIKKYEFQTWQNVRVIRADGPGTISSSVDLRKSLWGALKAEFKI